jgi:hypothetical protein
MQGTLHSSDAVLLFAALQRPGPQLMYVGSEAQDLAISYLICVKVVEELGGAIIPV